MLERVVIKNAGDYRFLGFGEVLATGDIDCEIVPGKINVVDPRIPIVFEILKTCLSTNKGIVYTETRESLLRMMQDKNLFGCKNKTLYIDLTFYVPAEDDHIQYVTSIDGSGNFIGKPTVVYEYIRSGKCGEMYSDNILNYDNPVEQIPFSKYSTFALSKRRSHYSRELEKSLTVLDYNKYHKSALLNLASGYYYNSLNGRSYLEHVIELLGLNFLLSKEYVTDVLETWLPKFDLGIEELNCEAGMGYIKKGRKDTEIPLMQLGSGAQILLFALPVLLDSATASVLSSSCGYFPELHPVLKSFIIEDLVLSGEKPGTILVPSDVVPGENKKARI